MGTRVCQVVSIDGSARNAKITKEEWEIYQRSREIGKAILEESELMRVDFENRLRLGATFEGGPMPLEPQGECVLATGSFFIPLAKAAAAK